VVSLLLCILEIQSSNFGKRPTVLGEVFRVFLSLSANVVTKLKNGCDQG
jgi:hypothetical protein